MSKVMGCWSSGVLGKNQKKGGQELRKEEWRGRDRVEGNGLNGNTLGC